MFSKFILKFVFSVIKQTYNNSWETIMNIVCKIRAVSLFYNFSIIGIQLCRKMQTSPLLLTFTFGSVNKVGKKNP